MPKVLRVVLVVVVLLTGCGARESLYDMDSYKNGFSESLSSKSRSTYKTYAEEIYNSEITVDEALDILGDEMVASDGRYYEVFVSMIDVINSQSKEDIEGYYSRWDWLSDEERLIASYMVMYGVLDIELYEDSEQEVINSNISNIQSGR